MPHENCTGLAADLSLSPCTAMQGVPGGNRASFKIYFTREGI